MTAEPILSLAQIEFFKEQGYLVLEDFIELATVEGWRQQIWGHLGTSLDHPKEWPNDYVVKDFSATPVFGHLPQMVAAVEQLGGGKFAGGGSGPLVQWPRDDGDWTLPSQGHIDGYGPGGWSGGFMLGATTYLYDVEPGGGAFVYWPGSHKPVHDYFGRHPEKIDGSFREGPNWESRSWGIFSDESPEPPREFTARAGTVVLWHCYMCHTGSANIRRVPRFGFFARWHHTDREEMRWDVGGDLWKHWAI
ncbi:MAG: hypothetical protein GKR89_34410 [Candidatus Latescibacteria bacterium]|nr:hypothetical protein [Candidatus Latescibacterota bacterium]